MFVFLIWILGMTHKASVRIMLDNELMAPSMVYWASSPEFSRQNSAAQEVTLPKFHLDILQMASNKGSCLFRRLRRLTSKEISKLRITGPLWRESTGDRWFPSQNASNAESVSTSWRHHGFSQCFVSEIFAWYGIKHTLYFTALSVVGNMVISEARKVRISVIW